MALPCVKSFLVFAFVFSSRKQGLSGMSLGFESWWSIPGRKTGWLGDEVASGPVLWECLCMRIFVIDWEYKIFFSTNVALSIFSKHKFNNDLYLKVMWITQDSCEWSTDFAAWPKKTKGEHAVIKLVGIWIIFRNRLELTPNWISVKLSLKTKQNKKIIN